LKAGLCVYAFLNSTPKLINVWELAKSKIGLAVIITLTLAATNDTMFNYKKAKTGTAAAESCNRR